MPSLYSQLRNQRIHILPGTLAGSPGNITSLFQTPIEAINTTARWLQPLPLPLLEWWLAGDGHIVINPNRHGYEHGPQPVRSRVLGNVAWLALSIYPRSRARYLTPVGTLLDHLLGEGSPLSLAPDAVPPWDQFLSGLHSCFRAGYGLSPEARTHVSAYLAEGIAQYLADRHQLNLLDPRLEKLLAATLFNSHFYRRQPHPESRSLPL